jgi:putative acetyltransferase
MTSSSYTMPQFQPLLIERASSPTAEARTLVEELDRELALHYPSEQRHGLDLGAILQPHIRFFVAKRDGVAVGCSGVALFAGFAEVKRMYVREAARGQGVADAILERLTDVTLDAGLRLLRLETGTEQGAAIRFYRRSGFQACAAFEPYALMPAQSVAASVFMEKWLVSEG